jgi:hypothetical protein
VRLRDYLRATRQLVVETRDAVYANRTAIGEVSPTRANVLDQLAGQTETLSRLEVQLNAQAEELATQSEALTNQSKVLTNHSEALTDLATYATRQEQAQAAEHRQLVEILRFALAHGPEAQQRLRRLRETPEYGLSYSEDEPLISVVIPTYDNYELLRARALPSVLGQSYQNFEVVVVGDAAPDDARKAVEEVGDPRISFFNLPFRGPYPSEAAARWFVVGTPPFNEAMHRAIGRWIAPLDDDDAFAPNHLERLLERARADRLELAYGQIDMHLPDGRTERRGSFPPQYGQFNLQAAIWHAGLSDIFQCHLADAALGVANDWALLVRMMEAGVRVGFLEEVLVDYYPARSGGSSAGYWGSPSSGET